MVPHCLLSFAAYFVSHANLTFDHCPYLVSDLLESCYPYFLTAKLKSLH